MTHQTELAEQFDRLWRGKYPFLVSTPGTGFPRPDHVEEALQLPLCRMPVPSAGMSLWYFRTKEDLSAFLRLLPQLRKTVMPRAT